MKNSQETLKLISYIASKIDNRSAIEEEINILKGNSNKNNKTIIYNELTNLANNNTTKEIKIKAENLLKKKLSTTAYDTFLEEITETKLKNALEYRYKTRRNKNDKCSRNAKRTIYKNIEDENDTIIVNVPTYCFGSNGFESTLDLTLAVIQIEENNTSAKQIVETLCKNQKEKQ